MAKELQGNAGPTQTGLTAYFAVWDATGQVRSGGTTFAVASAANRNSGAIAATELGTASGVYAADCPAFAAGVYSYALYKRVGGSPAESDTLLAGPGELVWDGSAPVVFGTMAQAAAAWGARDLGDGRTADKFLQGLTNLVVFAADGLSWTLMRTDDATPLATGTATRLPATVGGLRGVDPA